MAITKPTGSIDTVIGVNNTHNPEDNWIFYPNPVSDYLFVAHQNTKTFGMEVCDLTGKTVIKAGDLSNGPVDRRSSR